MMTLGIAISVAVMLVILCLYQRTKYSSLLKSIVSPICIVNRAGRIVRVVNKNYVSESPFSMNNVKNKSMLNILVNDTDKNTFIKGIEDVINGTEFKIKKKYNVRTQSGKHMMMVFNILYYGSDKVFVYMDDAPTVNAKEEKDVSHISEMVFDGLDIAVTVRDYSNRLTYKYWNKKAEELFGINKEEIIERDRSDFIDEDSEKKLEENALSLNDNNTEHLSLNVHCTKTNKYIPLSVSQQKVTTGKKALLVSCFTDTSLVKKNNDIINLLTAQCHLATKKAQMVMWIWDIQAQTISLSSENHNYPETLYENNEDYIVSLLRDEDKPRLLAIMDSVRNNKTEDIHIDFEYFKKNEEKYNWISIYGNVYKRDDKGNATKMMGISFNIDKNKVMESKIKKAERVLQQNNTSRSSLLKNINLVINNPLNSIIAYSQLLEDENDATIRKGYVKNLQEDSATLLNRINVLLQIANIQSGDATFIKQPVDLNGLIIEMRDMARSQNLNGNIKFEIEIPEVTVTLMLDNRYLMKVMNNLITNAMRYTFNGTITIGYNIYPDKRVYVFVADTGCGIAQERIKSLFDIFSAGSTQSANTSSGLGLPLCKAIIERLGGEIGVESELGKGSTFWFTINLGY